MARPTVRILSRYLLRQHLAPLGFALAAFTLLMLLRQVAQQFGNLVGKGLPWSVILEVFLLSVPFIVAMTLPMAVLVAVLYAFSQLAADHEITAMKASGVSLGRLVVPVLSAAALVAALAFLWSDLVLPRSNHRLRTLLDGDIREVNRSDPTQFDRTLYVVNKIRVQNVGNTLERTANDTYRSDREMSICEMRAVVAAARHEVEQVRRDTRFLIDNDLRRLAGLGPVLRDTLGLLPDTEPRDAYCRALRRMPGWLVPPANAPPPRQGVSPRQGPPPRPGGPAEPGAPPPKGG